MPSKEIQAIIDRATAGTITRGQATAEIRAVQDKVFAAIAKADEAFYQEDFCHDYEVIGASLDNPVALILRAKDGRELNLPFRIETRRKGGSAAPVVVWAPLELAPQYVVKGDPKGAADYLATAASRESARVTTASHDTQASRKKSPFWVGEAPGGEYQTAEQAEMERRQKARDAGAAAQRFNAAGGSPGRRVFSDQGSRGGFRLPDKTTAAGKKLDRWGDPI